MVLCVSSRQINDPTESSSYLISPLVLSLITEVLQVLLERDITTSDRVLYTVSSSCITLLVAMIFCTATVLNVCSAPLALHGLNRHVSPPVDMMTMRAWKYYIARLVLGC